MKMKRNLPTATKIRAIVAGIVLTAGLSGCAGLPERAPECPVSFAAAFELQRSGEFGQALQAYNAVFAGLTLDELPETCKPVLAKGQAGRGRILRELEDYGAAAKAFRAAENWAQRAPDGSDDYRLWQLAAVELELYHGSDVQKLREELFAQPPLPGYDGPELESALVAAWAALMRRQAEPELAAAMYARAADSAAAADQSEEASRLYRRKGNAHVLLRDNGAAAAAYRKAVQYAQAGGNPAVEAEARRELARAFARLRERDEAEEAWLAALELYESLEHPPHDRVADIKFDLAVLYELEAGRGSAPAKYRKALKAYERYFESSREQRVAKDSARHADIVRRYEAVRFRLRLTASQS